ncbi:MAG: hypothetical protein RIB43_12045 [Rhodospirillaceae bacterium]
MSFLSTIEQVAVRATLLKVTASTVACFLLIAIASTSVTAFMVIAANYGPGVAGATVAGGSIIFAALILIVAWELARIKKSADSTPLPSEKLNGLNGREEYAKQRADKQIPTQLAHLIQQNPMMAAGVALAAGIAVSSNPGLVKEVLKGINKANN